MKESKNIKGIEGLVPSFYKRIFEMIQDKPTHELLEEHIDLLNRGDALGIAASAMCKYEIMRREAEKKKAKR